MDYLNTYKVFLCDVFLKKWTSPFLVYQLLLNLLCCCRDFWFQVFSFMKYEILKIICLFGGNGIRDRFKIYSLSKRYWFKSNNRYFVGLKYSISAFIETSWVCMLTLIALISVELSLAHVHTNLFCFSKKLIRNVIFKI